MIKDLVEQLKSKVPSDLKFTSTTLLLGKLFQKLDRRVVDLEARQLQKGDKGDQGDQGIKGNAGRDGIDGKNGRDGLNGINGKDGKNGVNGKNGIAGVGVIDADIAIDDHLVLKLSNGDIIDAGELPKAKATAFISTSGYSKQITVSHFPPSNPELYDLWLNVP